MMTTEKEDLELKAFENKKDYQVSSIIGISLSIIIIISWYMLITNIDLIWQIVAFIITEIEA